MLSSVQPYTNEALFTKDFTYHLVQGHKIYWIHGLLNCLWVEKEISCEPQTLTLTFDFHLILKLIDEQLATDNDNLKQTYKSKLGVFKVEF